MKTLVVYYSRDGRTKKIAAALADLLQAETEELIDLTRRRGIWGWLGAGRDALRQRSTRLKPPVSDPADFDLLVVGSPVWAGSVTPAVRTYLAERSGRLKQVACFCSKGGTPTIKFFAQLEQLCGRRPLAVMEIKQGEELTGVAAHKMLQFADEIKKEADDHGT